MPSLSVTRSGQAWLSNFQDEDQPAARRLLDGVEMVSDDQFRREMKTLLKRARGERSSSTVAAYAVHNLPKNFAPHYFDCTGLHAPITPLRCPSTVHTGSELIVQNILVKSATALNVLVDATVEQMYDSRVHRVLLVTDNIASGQEISTFLEFMQANPRLRSWKSFGWLRFEVVTHCITESALASLRRKAVVHFEQLSRTFETTDWSDQQLDEVRALCRKYGSIRGEPLGRQNAESLQVFGHTFGNGTPAIMRQTAGRQGATWSPLLPHGRDYALESTEMAVLQGYRAPHSLLAALRRLGRANPIRVLRSARVDAQARNRSLAGRCGPGILALLSAIDAGHRRPVDLMKAGAMSLPRLHAVARASYDLKLIEGYADFASAFHSDSHSGDGRSATPLDDVKLNLTDRGREMLRRRARVRTPKLRPADPAAEEPGHLSIRAVDATSPPPSPAKPAPPYYPQQLR